MRPVTLHAQGGDEGARAEPPPAPRPVSATLRVATINMWGIPRVSTFIDERFAALAERLIASDLHVVGLQEVWAAVPRLALRQAVADHFPYQADFATDEGESGLLVLSRYPIGERHYTSFPVNGKPWKIWHGDWWGGKGIGVVRLDLPDGPLWFGVTHLHARYQARPPGGDEMDDQYAYDRWHQVHTLRHAVAARAGHAPAIVVGDFNFMRQSAFYRLLRGQAHQPNAAAARGAPWDEAGAAGGAGRIDLVWMRPGREITWQVTTPPEQIFTDPVPVPGAPPQPLTDHPAIGTTLTRVSTAALPAPYDVAPPPPPIEHLVPGTLAGWRLLMESGQAGEIVLLLGGALTLCALGLLVVPWRAVRKRQLGVMVRGAVGAGLLGSGLAAGWFTLEAIPMRAAGYAFWRATAPAPPSPLADHVPELSNPTVQ